MHETADENHRTGAIESAEVGVEIGAIEQPHDGFDEQRRRPDHAQSDDEEEPCPFPAACELNDEKGNDGIDRQASARPGILLLVSVCLPERWFYLSTGSFHLSVLLFGESHTTRAVIPGSSP